jgi:hypothetical protein
MEFYIKPNTKPFFSLWNSILHPSWNSLTNFKDLDNNAIQTGSKLLIYMVISLIFQLY